MMNEIWKYKFDDSLAFIETFDELPLWSAKFGFLLLENIPMKPNQTVLDIGSGAGFPLMELAERLGDTCKCYGLDTWANANSRAKTKVINYEITNVEIIEGSAESIPLESGSVDLIVSNLGINNFSNPDIVFKECNRVMKDNATLALTTNLNGHWREFYQIFEETLSALSMTEELNKLIESQEHRGTIGKISELFIRNGFEITKVKEEKFEMRFLNGTAFFNHHFVQAGWLSSWLELIPQQSLEVVFRQLEINLNTFSVKNNGLTLTVPMAYIEGRGR